MMMASVKKVFISSKPLSSYFDACLWQAFLIQGSAKGEVSYKVKKALLK